MKKIESLNPEQWAKIPQFVDKWVGIASGETDTQAAKAIVSKMYLRLGVKKPPIILHFTSPMLCHWALALLENMGGVGEVPHGQLHNQLCNQLGNQFYDQLYDQLGGQLYDQLHNQLYGQLHNQLCNQLGNQFYDQLYDQLRNQLGGQLYDQLYGQLGGQLYDQLHNQLYGQLHNQLYGQLHNQLYDQLYDQLRNQLGGQLYGQLRNQLGGQLIVLWWLVWVGYYDFCDYIGVQFDRKLLKTFSDFVSNIHFCLLYKNFFIYSHKPVDICWHHQRLHKDDGMAVKYADEWGWYALNGVRMKPEYVLTPADKLSPETVLKEQNVDIRRELLRKVGVLRMSSYGKEIDTMGDYKLLDMAQLFTGVRYAPHLLMKNPSLDDTWHLEGVSPECHTVQQAINWRAGNLKVDWLPAQLN